MAKIDKKANGRRAKGRLQPYAWLGAGAVTLGMGAAMASGMAVAHADDSSGAPSKGVSHSQNAGAGSGPSSKAGRAAKHAGPGAAAGAAKRSSAAQTSSSSDTADGVAPATAAVNRLRRASVALPTASVATAHAPAAASKSSAVAPSAAVPPTVPGPNPDQGQFIPKDITPGAHVTMAFGNIKDAQTALNQNTWGQTNILGGLAAIAPNVLLSAASFELNAWKTLNPIAQNLWAATAGIPIVHFAAKVTLVGTMMLPELSQLSLKSAALLMPVVGIFAPDARTAASPLIADATSNGRVYAVVRLKQYNETEPLVDAKVNGSAKQTLLVDTGSSGLVIDKANAGDLTGLTPLETGKTGSYSGGFDYTYDVYEVPSVDFGNGVTSGPTTINVVTSGTYNGQPSTLAEFLQPAGAVGILGVGANAYGPGEKPIPTSTLPGELSDGMLLYENLIPFFGGVMVFGPNPLPAKATLSGTPGSTLYVSVNGGEQQGVVSLIDSGGVYGTMPENIAPGGSDGYLPTGTKISVYAPDGTFLYKFTVGSTADRRPISIGATNQQDGDGNYTNYMNTGFYAFQGPVYIDYRNDGTYNNGGYGWTVFDIP